MCSPRFSFGLSSSKDEEGEKGEEEEGEKKEEATCHFLAPLRRSLCFDRPRPRCSSSGSAFSSISIHARTQSQ